MLKNKNKRKKGFTLIELVIVLAVLAIIALIAIPNFTKVRNDSMRKSDIRSAEQIEKITQMAIADEDLIPDAAETTITLNFEGKRFKDVDAITKEGDKDNYQEKLREVKAPQVNGTTAFKVLIAGKTGEVSVGYSEATTIGSDEVEWLVGPEAEKTSGGTEESPK